MAADQFQQSADGFVLLADRDLNEVKREDRVTTEACGLTTDVLLGRIEKGERVGW